LKDSGLVRLTGQGQRANVPCLVQEDVDYFFGLLASNFWQGLSLTLATPDIILSIDEELLPDGVLPVRV
jgi:hypothetical protein